MNICQYSKTIIYRETKQYSILVKHFLSMFFNNDFIKFDNQKKDGLIVLISIFVASGAFISHFLLYPYLWGIIPGASAATIWLAKTYFISLSMALTGIISVINWDHMFLDSRDYNNLFILPTRKITVYLAKIFSTLIFVGLLTSAFNVISILIFTFYLADMVNIHPLLFGLSHFLSNYLANLFVFFCVASIQSLLVSIFFKRRGYEKAAVLAQTLLLLIFISTFIWLPKLYPSLPMMKETYSPFFIYYFPPLWFVGLYEILVGNRDPVFMALQQMAIIGLNSSLLIYLFSVPFSFKKYLQPIDSRKRKKRLTKYRRFFKSVFDTIFLKNSIQKGIFYFSIRICKQSSKHKLYLTIFLATPLSIIATRLLFMIFNKDSQLFQQNHPFLLNVPLILIFFVLMGFRIIACHPFMVEANWVLKLTAHESREQYLTGFKKAVFFYNILPMLFSFCLFYFFLGWWELAIYHFIFTLLMAILLMEIFFLNFNKMPFASSYIPGKAKLKTRWPLYLAAVGLYIFFLSSLVHLLIKNAIFYFIFYTLILVIFFSLKQLQKKKCENRPLLFEDYPEAVMLTLNFD